MAKAQNEVQKNEELKENEVAEKVTETSENVAKEEEKLTETSENVAKDTKNVTKKLPVVKTSFRDKHDGKTIYNVGDTFVVDEKIEDMKPLSNGEHQYKVSKARYEELQRSLYVD